MVVDLRCLRASRNGAVVMPSATYKGQPKITMVHPSNPVELKWICSRGCGVSEFDLAEGETVDVRLCGGCGRVMRLYRPMTTRRV